MINATEKICERNLIAAYVDGELDADLTSLFEDHLDDCAPCRAELRAHRLFVCELDAAMNDSAEIPVPADFSRMVAVRATSDMRGVRTRSEHRKALTICLVLALGGFALIGATARDTLFLVARKFINTIFGVVGFVVSTIYDATSGVVVVARVLSRKIIVETELLWPMPALLGFGVLVLSRLLRKYHRTGATE